ncbi:glycosyl transferase, partial [Salmonella enterica subsp. enterica serovar Typhimurium]
LAFFLFRDNDEFDLVNFTVINYDLFDIEFKFADNIIMRSIDDSSLLIV